MSSASSGFDHRSAMMPDPRWMAIMLKIWAALQSTSWPMPQTISVCRRSKSPSPNHELQSLARLHSDRHESSYIRHIPHRISPMRPASCRQNGRHRARGARTAPYSVSVRRKRCRRDQQFATCAVAKLQRRAAMTASRRLRPKPRFRRRRFPRPSMQAGSFAARPGTTMPQIVPRICAPIHSSNGLSDVPVSGAMRPLRR